MFRLNNDCLGYRKQHERHEYFTGYQRREDELDAKFEEYKIQHENEKAFRALSETMREGKMVQHEDELLLKRPFDGYLETTKKGSTIQHKDTKLLKDLLETMKDGKVKPKNVACFALGSFERCGDQEHSFQQLAVLLKLMELLGMNESWAKFQWTVIGD